MWEKLLPLFFYLSLLTSSSLLFAAPKPDTLVLAIGGESQEGYDPTISWGRYGHPLFQSTLLARDADFNIIGDLATEYLLSEDRLTWRIKIREDVKFSDGQPLTARDVVFTFKQAALGLGIVDLTVMQDAVVIGPYELEIRLRQPEITFIEHLLKLGIVPEHAYGAGYARAPIGSGPYRLLEWSEGQQLIVEVNPFYYGPRPEFKRLVFLFMGSDAAFAAAKAGQVHVVAVPQTFARQTVRGMRLHQVKSVDNRGIMFPMLPEAAQRSSTGFIIGNNVTSDLAIRQAINYALHRQALVSGVLHGYGEPAFGIADGLPWDEPSLRFEDNDLAKARAILAQAGWSDSDGDGVLERDGVRAHIQLVYASSDLIRQNLALVIRDQLKPIGIEIEPVGASWDSIYNQYSFNSAVLYGWGDMSPLELYQIYHSKVESNLPDVSSFNPGRYHNPVVDAYLEQAQQSASFEESLVFWRKAQWDGSSGVGVQGDAVWAWLVNLTHTYFVSEGLDVGSSAIEPHGHGWPITRNITQWRWIE